MNLVLLCSVLGFLCAGVTRSEIHTYRVGLLDDDKGKNDFNYKSCIRERAHKPVDILLLTGKGNNYDETIKSSSELARDSNVYVVTQIPETIRCEAEDEPSHLSVVFNRNGDIISVYKRPTSNGKCNMTDQSSTFTTDFGVTFHYVTAEDIAVTHPEVYRGRNLVVVDSLPVSFLSQYWWSWSHHAGVNVISAHLLADTQYDSTQHCDDKLHVLEYLKTPALGRAPPSPAAAAAAPPPQAATSRLDLTTASQGLKQRLCHNDFCCHFYVKTDTGSKARAANYSLSAYSGDVQYESNKLDVQLCMITACDTTSCGAVFNKTEVVFEHLVIRGMFPNENAIQMPVSSSRKRSSIDYYEIDHWSSNEMNLVTLTLLKPSDLLSFGIVGRDFSANGNSKPEKINGVIRNLNENSNESDYVWISLRVLIFIVSIYVLEMM